ncbi:23S rRNA (uracil(1939)-C(5))-methyltransferase RlmD [Metallumcola ferriviriculae]|uniref:23S rRNA (Uracil(1939)-C(5))-methyltransferase RlmD n=1 Tax=Metallumcola ferriviriculae TaxID=3039180 RepID=A0AAU0URK0_9FIRM|nr:23S rRNA (uracil(1939)-C(5))-methyltransferase RlmD [Desulfitibacteraceae bacterium MK1]
MADFPVRQGQTVQLNIEDLTSEGNGVGRYHGLAVFVGDALPGEEVIAQITEVKKKYSRAKLLEVLTASEQRIAPRCNHFEYCGGCTLQHFQYPQQLAWKQSVVENALSRIGKIETEVLPVLGMQQPWQYRNKVQFQVGLVDGNKRLGLYAPGSHQLVPVETCHLLPEEFSGLVKNFNLLLDKGIPMKQVWLRKSFANGEIMAVVFTNGEPFTEAEALLKHHDPLVTVAVINDSNAKMSVVGKPRLKEQIGKYDFVLSPRAFFQVNTVQAEVLYETARNWANLTGQETLWDLYCGTGTVGIFMSEKCRRLVGIELNKAAVQDAKLNARLNGVKNASFRHGKAEERLKDLWQADDANVVILDPPRQGCDQRLLHQLLELGPEKIIYISCNPATLARDLKTLSDAYQIKKVQPVDMFPQTGHVECVVLIEKK